VVLKDGERGSSPWARSGALSCHGLTREGEGGSEGQTEGGMLSGGVRSFSFFTAEEPSKIIRKKICAEGIQHTCLRCVGD